MNTYIFTLVDGSTHYTTCFCDATARNYGTYLEGKVRRIFNVTDNRVVKNTG